MKVYFIGAGPGAADLITLRGSKILNEVTRVLYAGSLVSKDMLMHCHKDAVIANTAKMNLDEQMDFYREAKAQDKDVARVHSGDPAIYGAVAEQMRRLDEEGIEYEVVPGVSSFSSAAAVIKKELTKPAVSQTIILTRTSGKASPMPEGESIKELAAHQATMCIFLSGTNIPTLIEDLKTSYSEQTPVALVRKAEWPQQTVYEGTLGTVVDDVTVNEWELSTMMLVGEVLSDAVFEESQLYSADFSHKFRKAKAAVIT